MLLIVAVAGAGLILSLDHAPTEEGRPELTARGHDIVAPRLAAIDLDIQQLAAGGDGIAAAGRDTLTRLRTLDTTRTEEALEAGNSAVADVTATRDRITTARATLLEGISLVGLPASDRVRIGTIDAAMAAAGELPGYWQQVGVAASGPLEFLQSLQAHDDRVVTATDQGRAADWAAALGVLDDAQRLLVPVRAVREVAAKAGLDVTTLDDLLARIDDYDQSLIALYANLQASGGETTNESRAALARVEAAQASLPEDQSALVVIVSDMAGPTITPVLLSIESARGALEAALDAEPQPSGAATETSGSGPEPSSGVSS